MMKRKPLNPVDVNQSEEYESQDVDAEVPRALRRKRRLNHQQAVAAGKVIEVVDEEEEDVDEL